MTELLKQAQYSPLQTAEMAVTLYAVTRGYSDDIDVKRILPFEASLHQYLRGSYAELMNKIDATKDLDADAEAALKAAIIEFKKSWN